MRGFAGDVAWLSSHRMSDPSSSKDDVAHAVLVAAGEKMLVGDGLGQNIRGIIGKYAALVQSCLVMVLYWDDFQTLFSIA